MMKSVFCLYLRKQKVEIKRYVVVSLYYLKIRGKGWRRLIEKKESISPVLRQTFFVFLLFSMKTLGNEYKPFGPIRSVISLIKNALTQFECS